ncbi:hypothetical protein [Prosthecomicrobium sp. N25]|uniref:hypothetical protein n=1 Tax=Prosthecomicrobium sp. N25 TaxID=3129254 RepID=UPI003078A446
MRSIALTMAAAAVVVFAAGPASAQRERDDMKLPQMDRNDSGGGRNIDRGSGNVDRGNERSFDRGNDNRGFREPQQRDNDVRRSMRDGVDGRQPTVERRIQRDREDNDRRVQRDTDTRRTMRESEDRRTQRELEDQRRRAERDRDRNRNRDVVIRDRDHHDRDRDHRRWKRWRPGLSYDVVVLPAYWYGSEIGWCHFHRYPGPGMRFHRNVQCHVHGAWRDPSIAYVAVY